MMILNKLRSRLAIAWAKAHGVQLGEGVQLGRHCSLERSFREGAKGEILLGDGVCLLDGVILNCWGGKIRIGARSHLGYHSVVYGHGDVELGEDCLLGPHCLILSSEHSIPPLGTPINQKPDRRLPTVLGNDVWLGAGVKILAGCHVGDGCVVGAGAVVTHNLPAGSIAMGVPARVVRNR